MGAVALGTAVLSTLLLAGIPASGPETADAAGESTPVLAAEYFGSGSPVNMWNTDLSGARSAFEEMQSEGFNTVGLVVPWGGFQTKVEPPEYNSTSFARLDRLIRLAGSLHMDVILRLGYEFDNDPADQMPVTRFVEVFSNHTVYASWLAFISKVHQNVAGFSNVKYAYISWEDYWSPISNAEDASTTAEQIKVANQTGYTNWLKVTYSLSRVDTLYGTTFDSWSAVPTPSYSSPTFQLMYRYEDWALVHRLFEPAAARYPGLTMESRVDVDPLYEGTQVVGSYSHADTFDLPGTAFTGMYFSPYMSDPSSSPDETASEGVAALQSTLSSMSTRDKGQPLFIYEYEIVSNNPAVADDPSLSPSQVPAFIQGSEPLLAHDTIGYALWTFQDYNQSAIYNPSFTLGANGWHTTKAKTVSLSGGGGALSLRSGGSASQSFSPGNLGASSSAGDVTFSVLADATTSSSTTLQVRIAGTPAQTLAVSPGWHPYQLQFPASAILYSSAQPLAIQASGPTEISDVQLYAFTQVGDVISTTGTPELAAAPLKALNEQLAAGS